MRTFHALLINMIKANTGTERRAQVREHGSRPKHTHTIWPREGFFNRGNASDKHPTNDTRRAKAHTNLSKDKTRNRKSMARLRNISV